MIRRLYSTYPNFVSTKAHIFPLEDFFTSGASLGERFWSLSKPLMADDFVTKRLMKMSSERTERDGPSIENGVAMEYAIPKKGAAPVTEEQVITGIEKIAKANGLNPKDDYVAILNIGAPTEDIRTYVCTMACLDFTHFLLRRGLSRKAMSVYEYILARNALTASGMVSTGVSTFPNIDVNMNAEVEREISKMQASSTVFDDIKSHLRESGQIDLANRLSEALSALHIPGPREISGMVTDLNSKAAEEDLKRECGATIDEFQKFLSLPDMVNQKPLTHSEYYAGLAKEWFKVTGGMEQGYSVLGAIKRKKKESDEDFKRRRDLKMAEIIKTIREDLGRFHGINRIFTHWANFGEVIPVGFGPENTEVSTFDAKGMAKKILSVDDRAKELLDAAVKSGKILPPTQ